MARIGNKLIAICSAAIGIIYTAGYVVTESPAAVSTITQPIQTSAPAIQPPQSTDNELVTPQASNTPVIDHSVESTPPSATPPPKNLPTPTPKPVTQDQKYQDGTYSGSGTNRFGTVEVAVTIKNGKITNVDITSSRTRYPQKYIDPLPDEVITAQDYNIDTVSGATRSSEDFINAVHEALTQAEGNH